MNIHFDCCCVVLVGERVEPVGQFKERGASRQIEEFPAVRVVRDHVGGLGIGGVHVEHDALLAERRSVTGSGFTPLPAASLLGVHGALAVRVGG